MRDIKFQILWVRNLPDFTRVIETHYTTLNCLISGQDPFKYKDVEIIAKRQFTGLTDKNGIEIYEGDVVIAHSAGSKCTCEVKWGSGRVGFFLFNENIHKGWSLCGGGPKYGQETCEVIGNIHQHSNLLDNN